MYPNFQVAESKEKKYFYKTFWFKVIVWLLKTLQIHRVIHRLLKNTMSYRAGEVHSLLLQKKYKKGYDLSLDSLARFRKENDILAHYDWWLFMYYAAWAVQMLNKDAYKKQLLLLAKNGLKPFEGSHVSQCFSAFSRWNYFFGNYGEAEKQAKIAKKADETNADPDFLLGWYKLILHNGDPMPYFKKAIAKDFSITKQIIDDKSISKYPEVVDKIKAHMTVSQ
jgi:hypothetical protein